MGFSWVITPINGQKSVGNWSEITLFKWSYGPLLLITSDRANLLGLFWSFLWTFLFFGLRSVRTRRRWDVGDSGDKSSDLLINFESCHEPHILTQKSLNAKTQAYSYTRLPIPYHHFAPATWEHIFSLISAVVVFWWQKSGKPAGFLPTSSSGARLYHRALSA